MSPMTDTPKHAATRFPRVSGDEPAYQMHVGAQNGFSPRERG